MHPRLTTGRYGLPRPADRLKNAGSAEGYMQVIVPPMLADLVAGSIIALDGAEFTRLRRCPTCGREVRGHDMKRRRFAVIKGPEGEKEIAVWVKRFHCTGCGTLCTADAPFYPETRVGAPIVDLCLVLTEDYPFNHAARILGAMRIVLDRGSVRNTPCGGKNRYRRPPSTACASPIPSSHSSPFPSAETSPAPSKGQKFSRPAVSHPQTGHRFIPFGPKKGTSGMKRKKKKKGRPRRKPTAVRTSDPASRTRLSVSRFVAPPRAPHTRGGRRPSHRDPCSGRSLSAFRQKHQNRFRRRRHACPLTVPCTPRRP